MQEDYYEILMIDPDASQEDIEKSYRKLAAEFHPDVNKKPDAHEFMMKLNRAYDVLKNSDKRSAYHKEWTKTHSAKKASSKHYSAKTDIPSLIYRHKALFAAIIIAVLLIALLKVGEISLLQKKTLRYDFGKGNYSFKPVGSVGQKEGTLSIVESIEGSDNNRCLQFEYYNKVDSFIGIGTMEPDLSGLKEIRLRIRSGEDRIFAISLDELQGRVFIYPFELKKGQWTEITAKPEDFIISAHLQETERKLNPAELSRRLVIADLSGDRGIIGPNTFWVDWIEIAK